MLFGIDVGAVVDLGIAVRVGVLVTIGIMVTRRPLGAPEKIKEIGGRWGRRIIGL